VKKLSILCLVFLGCSGLSLNDAPAEADPDARALLPRDVGVFITESSVALDAAAIESILPGTHRRSLITGLGLDTDMQLRRLHDKAGKEHIFTLQDTQGVVVERDREGRTVRRFDVFEPGNAARANPLDVAFDQEDNLWITRHGEKSLIVISLAAGTVVTKIDLAPFADDDGFPDMSAIAIVDKTAYVALRRLESGFGTLKNAAQIVAIDTDTFAVRPYLELPAKDPGPKFRAHRGALFISCIGGPLVRPEPDRNAALVRIDLANGTATKVLDAEAAGGFVTAFDLVDDRGYAIVAEFTSDNPTRLVRFDLASGKIDATWARTSSYQLWDVAAVKGSLLLVADRAEEAPGLRVLSTTDGAQLGKIPTKLLPIETVVLLQPDS
jgi:hypothetical protein